MINMLNIWFLTRCFGLFFGGGIWLVGVCRFSLSLVSSAMGLCELDLCLTNGVQGYKLGMLCSGKWGVGI